MDAISWKTALQTLVDLRKSDQVVITSMGACREWPKIARHPLDFHYVPSTMGGAVPLALGLALAQPQREVLVCSGDGSLLMNLGCLATVAQHPAPNLTVALLDNGVYEITGGQKTAAYPDQVNFAEAARACGWKSVFEFAHEEAWIAGAEAALQAPGPRFIGLKVRAEREDYLMDPPGPVGPRLKDFREALIVEKLD